VGLPDGGGDVLGTGGDYTYTYKAGGNTYVQSSQPPFITGDITGH
jgi:hypothetical protein